MIALIFHLVLRSWRSVSSPPYSLMISSFAPCAVNVPRYERHKAICVRLMSAHCHPGLHCSLIFYVPLYFTPALGWWGLVNTCARQKQHPMQKGELKDCSLLSWLDGESRPHNRPEGRWYGVLLIFHPSCFFIWIRISKLHFYHLHLFQHLYLSSVFASVFAQCSWGEAVSGSFNSCAARKEEALKRLRGGPTLFQRVAMMFSSFLLKF